MDCRAVVYEIETDACPEREREKVAQYAGPLVRDVVVIPVEAAPEAAAASAGWIKRFVLG